MEVKEEINKENTVRNSGQYNTVLGQSHSIMKYYLRWWKPGVYNDDVTMTSCPLFTCCEE